MRLEALSCLGSVSHQNEAEPAKTLLACNLIVIGDIETVAKLVWESDVLLPFQNPSLFATRCKTRRTEGVIVLFFEVIDFGEIGTTAVLASALPLPPYRSIAPKT